MRSELGWTCARGAALALALAVVLNARMALADESSAASDADWGPLTALGSEIKPGEKQRLASLDMGDFAGMRMAVPVWVARGVRPGKTLCVVAGIHGDELNGIEIARRIFVETDPE